MDDIATHEYAATERACLLVAQRILLRAIDRLGDQSDETLRRCTAGLAIAVRRERGYITLQHAAIDLACDASMAAQAAHLAVAAGSDGEREWIATHALRAAAMALEAAQG